MTFDEAKYTIQMHAGTKRGPKMQSGFIGCLRPYCGLSRENFEEVVEAIVAASEHLRGGPMVDRELVFALWSMCDAARRWGVSESGMLPRNNLISCEDRQTLESWIDILEHMTIHLLRGNPLHLAISPYAEAIAFGKLPAPGSQFVSVFIGSLEVDDADVRAYAAGALGQMGEASREAVPALRVCSLDANREVSEAATAAIEQIMYRSGRGPGDPSRHSAPGSTD